MSERRFPVRRQRRSLKAFLGIPTGCAKAVGVESAAAEAGCYHHQTSVRNQRSARSAKIVAIERGPV
jgi:hypothetical protein